MEDASDNSAIATPSRLVSFDDSTFVYSISATENELGDKTITVFLTASDDLGQ